MNTPASVPSCAPAPVSVLEAVGISYRNNGGLVDVAVADPRQSLHELYANSKTESMDHAPAGGLDLEVWGMYAGAPFHICLKPSAAPVVAPVAGVSDPLECECDSGKLIAGDWPAAEVASVQARFPGPECAPASSRFNLDKAPLPAVPALPPLVRGKYDKDEHYCWAFVVRDLFLFLERSGFPVMAVDNGDGCEGCADDVAKAISDASACDACFFYCATPSGEKHLTGQIVLGNSPSELVADYGTRQTVDGQEWDSLLSSWSDSWLAHDECPTWAQVSAGFVKA